MQWVIYFYLQLHKFLTKNLFIIFILENTSRYNVFSYLLLHLSNSLIALFFKFSLTLLMQHATEIPGDKSLKNQLLDSSKKVSDKLLSKTHSLRKFKRFYPAFRLPQNRISYLRLSYSVAEKIASFIMLFSHLV
jgi:hypothetical protein